MNDLTLIIPAKNESESLPQVIDSLKNLTCKIKVSLQINDKATINSIKDKNVEIFLKEHLKVKNIDINTRCHPTTHNHYSTYYDDETMLLVKKYYQKDIDYFGYTYTAV